MKLWIHITILGYLKCWWCINKYLIHARWVEVWGGVECRRCCCCCCCCCWLSISTGNSWNIPCCHSQPNKSNLNLLNGPPTPKKRLEASSLVPTGTPWWLNPAVSRGYHWDEDLCGASWWTRRSQGGIAKRPARSIKIWEKWLGLRDI